MSRWSISLAFGLLTGWAASGVIVPVLARLMMDVAARPLISLVLLAAVAIGVTLSLARIGDGRRRLGWGCIAAGCAMMLNGAVVLALTGVLAWLFGYGPAQPGEVGAILFVLTLGAPYVLLGIALVLGGFWLRRKPRPSHPDRNA